MYIFITISNIGVDVTGPFDIFSDVDGFVSAFEYNVPLASLLAGYGTNNVPDLTTTVRIKQSGIVYSGCTGFYIDTLMPGVTTTTTTTTAAPTTTTTTTTV